MIVRKIATFAFIFAIVALVVGLSSCDRVPSMMPDSETSSTEDDKSMAEGITIGVALALTGANAEPYGIPMRDGLELAREEINMLGGPSITFITEDALSTTEGAITAVQALVDQGVPAIVGIGLSEDLKHAFPIANGAGVIAFSPISSASGLSALGDYIFRAGLAVDILTPTAVMTTQAKLGYTKVATIYDVSDTYSTSSNDELRKALEANNVTILTEETFEKGDTGDIDVSEQLTKIMDMEPDALFISALSSQMTQVITQGRAIDALDSVHFIVPDLTNAEAESVGEDAEGIIAFAGWSTLFDTPGNQDFIQNYQMEYSSEPSPWAAQAYATLYILAEAIKNAESTDAAAIRDALAQTKDFPTILGNFSFDENGEAMYDRAEERIVLIVEGGKLKVFGE